MSVRLGAAAIAVLGVAILATVGATELLARSGLGLAGRSALAALAGAVPAAAIAWPLWFSLRRRLRGLSRATRALTQGDFDAPLPPPADDDLGDLQRAWKRMRMAMEEQMVELRSDVERQRSILDGMAEGVALLHDGEIVADNPAFGELIGAHGPLAGKTVLEAARLPELAEVIEESVRTEAEVVREINTDRRVLRVAARPLGAKQRRSVIVLLDMTESRRLERMRRDFVANASHELRTPVAAILGVAETLAGGAADDEAARRPFVEILTRHANRLGRLTADLLDLARLEAGYRPRIEVVAVPQVVDAVLMTLAPRAGERGITLSTAIGAPSKGALAIAAEPAAVEQVLTNLVDNAIKYTPTGGRVVVTADADDDGRVRITVADTGPGIAAEHLPRLFERFYRVDDARSRELGGTGLGLSIVRHLVAANAGEIHVDSELGQGTRFTVFLPGVDRVPNLSPERHKASTGGA
jgi:two-component system phosphate regulon sensor histidine kinase PhoR